VNLLDMGTKWSNAEDGPHLYERRGRQTGELTWKATSVDLAFDSNSQLRAIAEVYACADPLPCAPPKEAPSTTTRHGSPVWRWLGTAVLRRRPAPTTPP
jgi:hypothetical protein